MGAVVLIVATLTALARPVAADQITDKLGQAQHQKQSIDREIARLNAEIAAARNQEGQLQAIISTLDAQINTAAAQVTAAQAQLDDVTATLNAEKAQLAAAQQHLAAQKSQLAKQLVAIYELQQESTPINNLLTSGSFNEFWTSVIDGRRISDQEMAMVDMIYQQQNVIQGDVNAIALEREQQQATVAQLTDAKLQLDGQRTAQQHALTELTQLQTQDQAREQQMQAADNALNAQIAQLQQEEAQAVSAGGGSGRFSWPESGPISQGFGCTSYPFEPYDPSCPQRHFHNGLDIAGPCGNPIHAADAGIAHIEPFQSYGFGNYIIIVHGNGWETLYGHLAAFAIRDGQTVGRGQVIGYEGTTGNSTGCHLHFGVNLNNQWVNPLAYLS